MGCKPSSGGVRPPCALAALVALTVARAPCGAAASDLHHELEQLRKEIQVEESRTQAFRDNATATRQELSSVSAALAKAREEAQEATSAATQEVCKDAELLCLFGQFPSQGVLAISMGALGGAGLLGPPNFRVAFSAVSGAAIGGLLVIAAVVMFFSQLWALITWTEAASLPDQLGRVAVGGASVPVYLLWTLLLVGGILRWLQGLKERASSRTPREPSQAGSQAGGSEAAPADQADPEPPNGDVADEAAPRGAGVGPIRLKDPTMLSGTLPFATPGISAGSTTQRSQPMSSPDPERHETLELKKPSEYSTLESDTSPEVGVNALKTSTKLPSKRQSRVAKMVRCQGAMCRKISEED